MYINSIYMYIYINRCIATFDRVPRAPFFSEPRETRAVWPRYAPKLRANSGLEQQAATSLWAL